MSVKILTKNSIDNTNIDGARQNHFSAGMKSGIVKGAFNEGRFFASASNVIALDSCELRISGHQVVIDSIEAITLNDRPSVPTKYSMIAEIQVSDISVPSFRLFIQPANVVLKQDNLFKTEKGSGIYQLRIGNFTLGTTGLISDVIRTADIITGGGQTAVADIKFNATATQLSSSSEPSANIDYNEETGEYDAHFGIPAGSGSKVLLGGVEQNEWSADFVEDEKSRTMSEGAIVHNNNPDLVFARNEKQRVVEEGAVVHENNENLEFAKSKRINTTNLWDNSQLESTTSCIPSATGFRLINTTNYDVHTNKCKISLRANTTYTISCRRIASTTNNGFIYCKWFGVDGSTLWENNIESEEVLFTPSVEIVAVDFYIKHDQPLNSYVEIEELQINEGTDKKPFESFKGGALVQTKDLYNYVNNDKLKLVNIFGGNANENTQYSLSRPITDFTFICIRVKWTEMGSDFTTIPKEACLNYNSSGARVVLSTDVAYLSFYFPSADKWACADLYGNNQFVQIYGIL